jgi:hypothetical protein
MQPFPNREIAMINRILIACDGSSFAKKGFDSGGAVRKNS